MWLTDLHGIFYTLFYTGIIGFIASAVLYAFFAFITRKKLAAPLRTHLLRFVFLVYVVCVFMLTLSFSKSGSAGSVNFVPFSSVFYALDSGFETARYLIALNIIMFIPMGVLLPCVFKKVDKLYKAALISLAATIVIELIQILLPVRAFDIDDILMNTLGCAIGFALFAVFSWMFKKREHKLQTKTASILILAFVPVFVFVYTLSSSAREFENPFYSNPMAPKDIVFTINADKPMLAMVYKKDDKDPYEKIKRFKDAFGFDGEVSDEGSYIVLKDGDKKISVSKEHDFWNVFIRETNNKPAILTDAELEKQAKDCIASYGLWEEYWVIDNTSDILTDDGGGDGWEIKYDPETGEEILPSNVIVTGKTVTFKVSEESPNTGDITIYFDSEGVYELSGSLSCYVPYKEAELMSPKDAVSKFLKSGRCYMESDIIKPHKAVIEDVFVAYMNSTDSEYNLPVWEMSGTFYGTDAHGNEIKSQGTITLFAIK